MTSAAQRFAPWAVVLLTLLAFFERAAGIGARLPHAREADTAIVHYAAWADAPADAQVTWTSYPSTVYPVFLGKLLARLPGAGSTIAAPADAPLQAHLDAASAPYVRARWMIALLSLIAIPCTYLFARNWLERGWAVLAAAFAATSLLALELGVVAKPHGAVGGFSALALWTMLRLLRNARFVDYAAAGLATGCAMAALNSGLFLFPSFVLAHIYGRRSDRDPRRWVGFLFALAAIVALVLVSYSYALFPGPGGAVSNGAVNIGETTIAWDSWNPAGFREMLPEMLNHDPALTVLALAAVVIWIVQRARRSSAPRSSARPSSARSALLPANVVVGVFVAIWFLAFGLHEPYYARYALPILPILAALAASSIRVSSRFAAERIPLERAPAGFAVALAAVALALPTYATFHLARLRTRDDTVQVAARWIREHVARESDTVVLGAMSTIPLCSTRDALATWPLWGTQPWVTYQREFLPEPHTEPDWNLRSIVQRGMLRDRKIDREEVLARLENLQARWAVVTIPTVNGATQDATRATLRELVGEPRVLIWPFRPSRDPETFTGEDTDIQYVWGTLARERLGPAIEIYALP